MMAKAYAATRKTQPNSDPQVREEMPAWESRSTMPTIVAGSR
jgi:hypothetical protein